MAGAAGCRKRRMNPVTPLRGPQGDGHSAGGRCVLSATTGEQCQIGLTIVESVIAAGKGQRGMACARDGRKVMLTIGDPAATWLIDIAGGETVATAIPMLPSWQRLAH